MPTNNSRSGLSPHDLPMVEVWLDVGEALRLGNNVLRVLDTDGENAMLRVETVTPADDDESRWAELPR